MTTDLERALQMIENKLRIIVVDNMSPVSVSEPDPSQPVDMVIQACPFCGGSEKYPVIVWQERRVGSHHKKGLWIVECDNCAANIPSCANKDEAYLTWNTRAQKGDAPRLLQREVELMAEAEKLKKQMAVNEDGFHTVIDDLRNKRLALEATTKDLLAALVKAAEQFRFYQQQHMAKMPPDISKADTNKVYADNCEAAIARAKVQS